MEPLEFLGGKYQQPEQIVPGDVQTFRAREASTGRTVFIHRVSTLGNDPDRTALLRLLLLCLFRSSSAKRQVLDFSDEPGYCYVVTESSPQCLLLKEWLQFEIDHSGVPGSTFQSEGVVDVPAKIPPPRDSAPPAMAADNRPVPAGGGDFTRMFVADTPIAPPASFPAQPLAPAASTFPGIPELPPSKVQPADGGEFTRMFRADPGSSVPAPASRAPEPQWNAPDPPVAAPAPAKPDNGEFTRFFSGGLPSAAPAASPAQRPVSPQPSAPPVSLPQQRTNDRPSNPGGLVQRPNTPPPPQLKGTETGEFTKMFSRNAFSGGTPDAPRPQTPPANPPSLPRSDRQAFDFDNPRASNLPDLSNKRGDVGSMFDSAPEVPTPMPSASQTPGEYTRMFGKGGAPPSIQPPSSVADRPMVRLNDPFPEAAATPAAPAGPSGPGEFTRVIQGNRTGQDLEGGVAEHGQPSGGGPSGAPSGGAPSGGAGASPIKLDIKPMNPMAAMGSAMQVPGAMSSLGGGMGSASAGMGNPVAGGNMGHASVMSPVGSAFMSGPNMQNAMQGSPNASHNPHAPQHSAAGGAPAGAKLPKMPGQLPKAPNVGVADRTKLLILFGVLALLVVVMILFVIFSAHK